MLHIPMLIPPSAAFWSKVAHAMLGNEAVFQSFQAQSCDFSDVVVVVPNFIHAQQLKTALASCLQRTFIPPRITTMAAWLALLPPDFNAARTTSNSERLMGLYAELRQHAWLKKLFGARRNTDLMPLAHTLLTLFDELSVALLPSVYFSPDTVDERWQAALEQLPQSAREVLSDEAQLVWTLWKSQLDGNDATTACFAKMMRLANQATQPLVWISALKPDPLQQAFLKRYSERQAVMSFTLDWHAEAVCSVYAAGWPDMLEEPSADLFIDRSMNAASLAEISLCPARSLEEEALRGAQIIIDWLRKGKSSIAIIAQDRVVARRIRALLERAQVFVADETGWKLSTTRTAAAVAALLDTVVTRAETAVLLDLLKSPFLFSHIPDKAERVMVIEQALRRANILGGWEAVLAVLRNEPLALELLQPIAEKAHQFSGRKSLAEWGILTSATMEALGMRTAMEADAAGVQVIALLDALRNDCDTMPHVFSFSEWRAFLGLQLESTPFVPAIIDQRVMMLQLNGAHLRAFDAVLMVGADADHLPSQLNETLFFANAVRRELGLATREMRQRMQLRDFAELLSSNPVVVLSWQQHKNGEPNSISTWIERLQLALLRSGLPPIPVRQAELPLHRLRFEPVRTPAPVAPQLVPQKLSASGYNSLVACPYQFFATRMLGLDALHELSELPEKRDYGDWLHEILYVYHQTLCEKKIDLQHRAALLLEISEAVFSRTLAQSAAALGYYARWLKTIPAYLAWANERERQGWKFVKGEQWVEKTLVWNDGRITLRGCIDRIDENETGERVVLDYKTKNVAALRDKLKDGEDHQLAFYGLLSDVPAAGGHYVALEPSKDKTGDVAAENFAEWQAKLEAQIVANIRAIAQGTALSATGIERICVYCEVRGLCRKGAW